MLSDEADNDLGAIHRRRSSRSFETGASPLRRALFDANGPTGTFSNEDGARSRGDVDPNV